MKGTCTKFVFLFILYLSWFPAQLSWAQAISTVAGNGTNGGAGDGAPASNASVRALGVAMDASGNIYIADTEHHKIRKVDAGTKIITTVAGNGTMGYSGDDGPAVNAALRMPYDVAVAANGDLYIADYGNNRIRKVNASDGKISTVAGNGSTGYGGDGGPATSARIYAPAGVALDASGNLYLSEYNGHRIRKVNASDGFINTIAGTGIPGFTGDNMAATSAAVKNPWGIAVDANGNILFADYNNYRIRQVNASDGMISTVAGTGLLGFTGDGGAATAARIGTPAGIAITSSGNIYFSERNGNRIRKVSASDGKISTIAGSGAAGFAGDGGPAQFAEFYVPSGVEVDVDANIFVADYGNGRIRRIEGFVNNGLTLQEGGKGALTKSVLEFTDTNQPPSAITYTVTATVASGVLFKDGNHNNLADTGEILVPASTFTQSDVDAGIIKYHHNGLETATDEFGFSISDNAGKTLKDKTFIFTIIKVNDAPVIADNGPATWTTPEDTELPLTDVQVSDAEPSFDVAFLELSAEKGIIKVKDDVAGGVADFEILGNNSKFVMLMAPLSAINATLAANGVVYAPDLNVNGTDRLALNLNDNGSFTTGSGGPQMALLNKELIITPVNDTPVITSNGGGAAAAISMPEKVAAVTTVTTTDVENDAITYSLSGGADQAQFSIDSASGALVFVTAPDFRAPADGNADNVYEVTVRATDNGAGNAFDEQSITVTILDTTPPTVTGIKRKNPAKPTTNATSLTYTLTFVEPVSGVDASDFTLTKTGTATGASLAVAGSGTSYEVTVNGVTGDGTLRLDVNASGTGIVDNAGLGLAAGFAEGHLYIIDNKPPVVTGVEPGKFYGNDRLISFNEGDGALNGAPFAAGSTVSPEGAYTLVVTDSVAQTTTIPFTIDKTSPSGTLTINKGAVHTNLTGVTLDLTADDGVGAGTADMRFSHDNSAWTAWEPFAAVKAYSLPAGDGLKTVYLQLRDAVGNLSGAVSDDISLDQTKPSVSLATKAANPTNLDAIPVTVHFSEAVADFDLADIQVTGGTKGDFAGSGTDYSFTIRPTGNSPITVEVAAGAAQDNAANGNTAAAQLLIHYDGVKPTVTLATIAADPTNLNPIPVTVTFSEPVTGFDLADVVVAGGTKGGFSGSGTSYSFTIIPAGDGPITVDLAADAAQDNAANGNTAAAQLLINYNGMKPTVTLATNAADPTNLNPIPVTVTFSEPVTGFDLSDISLSGGSKAGFSGSDASYSFTITPAGNGPITVNVAADVAQDNATNGNIAAAPLLINYDGGKPMVTLATLAADPTNQNPIPVRVTFSEPVTGFDLADVVVVGGTKAGFSGSGTDYSFTITPTANAITADVPAGVAQDHATNGNTAAARLTLHYDGGKPTVTLATVAPNPTNLNLIPVTVTFSEPVTGFDLADVVVVGGTKAGLSGSGANYMFTIVPAGDGLVTASVAANAAADAATNGNQASNTLSRTYDATKPTLFITAPPFELVRAAFTATFTFSEPVTGFALEDIVVENGTVSNFIVQSATVYTALLTPEPVGLVTVNVAANIARDGAGNGNLVAVPLRVEDVSCGISNDKVYMCHEGQLICVALSSVQAHLVHGDNIGSCPSPYKGNSDFKVRDMDLTIYPNPARDIATIEFTLPEDTKFDLTLYDLKGTLVKKIASGKGVGHQFFQYQLNVKAYPSGVYVVRLTTTQRIATKRLIIQK